MARNSEEDRTPV